MSMQKHQTSRAPRQQLASAAEHCASRLGVIRRARGWRAKALPFAFVLVGHLEGPDELKRVKGNCCLPGDLPLWHPHRWKCLGLQSL